jgi:molecular chaperone GrpE
MATTPAGAEEAAATASAGTRANGAAAADAEAANSTEDESLKRLKAVQEALEKSEKSVTALQKEKMDAIMRSAADMENVRRIARDDVAKAKEFGVSSLVKQLLPVVDNLTAAMNAVPASDRSLLPDRSNAAVYNLWQGVSLTQKNLLKVLAEHKVTMYGAAGDKFNPQVHEAVGQTPVSDPAKVGTITEVLMSGFMLGQRVLRAAQVRVGVASDQEK